jgi:hypothetical protein
MEKEMRTIQEIEQAVDRAKFVAALTAANAMADSKEVTLWRARCAAALQKWDRLRRYNRVLHAFLIDAQNLANGNRKLKLSGRSVHVTPM